MNNMEEFIKKNRSQLDFRKPPGEIWRKVEADLFPKEKSVVQRINYLRMAAAISLLIISIGVYQFLATNSNQSSPKEDLVLMAINTQYAREIAAMKKDIQNRQKEIEKYNQAYPNVGQPFNQNIDQLNITYKNLHENLLTIDNEKVLLRAMIDNLKMQLELLDRQLEVIQKIKKLEQHEDKHPTL